jgi:hypothetical protein
MSFTYVFQLIGNPALNQSVTPNTQGGASFLARAIPAFVTIVLIVGVVAFLFMLISGGISWMSSGGDKSKIESARTRVTNALVGIVLLLSLYAVLGTLEYFFNVNLTAFRFGEGTFQIETFDYDGSINPNDPTDPGDPPLGPVNVNCPCSAVLVGNNQCARTNQIAIGPASACYICTDGGWQHASTTDCSVINNCSPCP